MIKSLSSHRIHLLNFLNQIYVDISSATNETFACISNDLALSTSISGSKLTIADTCGHVGIRHWYQEAMKVIN